MIVRFWGVRGSVPVPGPTTVRIGGNTSCVEIRPREDLVFIVDCGTGIRECGNSLLAKMPIKGYIFMSHTHWDHIHGFPFFVPAYIPINSFIIHGPSVHDANLEATMRAQMEFKVFPMKLEWMASKMEFKELGLGDESFEIEGVKITTRRLNHPVPTLGYRFEYNGHSVVTMFDTERWRNLFEATEKTEEDPLDFLGGSGSSDAASEEGEQQAREENQRDADFARGADLLVLDTQYTDEEYYSESNPKASKKNWGHSTIEQGLELGAAADVKRLAFFHHEPMRNDDGLEQLEDLCAARIRERGLKFQMFAAREKMEIDCTVPADQQNFGGFAR